MMKNLNHQQNEYGHRIVCFDIQDTGCIKLEKTNNMAAAQELMDKSCFQEFCYRLSNGNTNNDLIESIKYYIEQGRVYKANDRKNLKKLIDAWIKANGNNCELNWIDVSEVHGLQGIFAGTNFNGDISKWNLSDSDKVVLWR